MGTSYVEYKGCGFWSRDDFLGDWINAILPELMSMTAKEPWLGSLADHWRTQAEIDGGCMSLELDEFLDDERKRDLIISFSQRTLKHCSDRSRRTGQLFIDLLSGQLKTNASSPIDYL